MGVSMFAVALRRRRGAGATRHESRGFETQSRVSSKPRLRFRPQSSPRQASLALALGGGDNGDKGRVAERALTKAV
jgi:hypothetical protein